MENYQRIPHNFADNINRNCHYNVNRNHQRAESYKFRNQNRESEQIYYKNNRRPNYQCPCENEVIRQLQYEISQQQMCHEMLLTSMKCKDEIIELLRGQNEHLMSLLSHGNHNVMSNHPGTPTNNHQDTYRMPPPSQEPAKAPGIHYGMNYMPPRYTRSSTPKKELLDESCQSEISFDETSLDSYFDRMEYKDQQDFRISNGIYPSDFQFEQMTSNEETLFNLSTHRTSWFFLGNLTQAEVRVEQLKMLCAEFGDIQHFFCDFKKGIVLCKFMSLISADAAYHGLNNRELFNVRIVAETPNDMEVQWLLKQLKLEEIVKIISDRI